MPRKNRIIVEGLPHHVIQRGNRGQQVFFNDADRRFYLNILNDRCRKHRIKVWAYCLMSNHVHLIMLPETADGLSPAIGEAHQLYSCRINERNAWRGGLWQGRFLSFVMHDSYLFAAVRYVERNPVRGGLAQRAEDYPWSSAPSHVKGSRDPVLSPCPLLDEIEDWTAYLRSERKSHLEVLRKHSRSCLPLGRGDFLNALSFKLSVPLESLLPATIGRPTRPTRPNK